ncbi:MAG: hypothetical protein AABW79_03260 [Nanoarchaeota archaeon]
MESNKEPRKDLISYLVTSSVKLDGFENGTRIDERIGLENRITHTYEEFPQKDRPNFSPLFCSIEITPERKNVKALTHFRVGLNGETYSLYENLINATNLIAGTEITPSRTMLFKDFTAQTKYEGNRDGTRTEVQFLKPNIEKDARRSIEMRGLIGGTTIGAVFGLLGGIALAPYLNDPISPSHPIFEYYTLATFEGVIGLITGLTVFGHAGEIISGQISPLFLNGAKERVKRDRLRETTAPNRRISNFKRQLNTLSQLETESVTEEEWTQFREQEEKTKKAYDYLHAVHEDIIRCEGIALTVYGSDRDEVFNRVRSIYRSIEQI